MTDNTLELHWDHFETNAPNMFRNLWNDQDFADVTLATVDDHQIRAHKVILSSCSQLFRNIFLMNPHQNPLLYLKGIRYKELALVIKFIYLGQCEVGQYELSDFLTTGSELKVGGLMEDVNLKIIEEPVVDNGTHYTQEPQEPDSNYTDHDGKIWEMSNQKNESEVTTTSLLFVAHSCSKSQICLFYDASGVCSLTVGHISNVKIFLKFLKLNLQEFNPHKLVFYVFILKIIILLKNIIFLLLYPRFTRYEGLYSFNMI